MKSISTVIGKVIPKLRSLQENPEVYIISVPSASKIASPFEQENFSAPSKKEAIPEKVKCIFSEKPEIITKNNQIMTIKVVTFFISELDYGKKISYDNRFIFKGDRYTPLDVSFNFGLWTIKTERE